MSDHVDCIKYTDYVEYFNNFWFKSCRTKTFKLLSSISMINSVIWKIVELLRLQYNQCVKSVRIRGYSGPHFPAFGLNTEKYGVSLRIQSECGKMWSRITTNMETFQALNFTNNLYLWNDYCDFITLPKVKKESQGWILLKR